MRLRWRRRRSGAWPVAPHAGAPRIPMRDYRSRSCSRRPKRRFAVQRDLVACRRTADRLPRWLTVRVPSGSSGYQPRNAESTFCASRPRRAVSLDNLELHPAERRHPGPGQVEIAVEVAGLVFRDVLNALDLYPGDPGPLGGECGGIIAAVGAGVDGFREGDEVIAMAPARTTASFWRTRGWWPTSLPAARRKRR